MTTFILDESKEFPPKEINISEKQRSDLFAKSKTKNFSIQDFKEATDEIARLVNETINPDALERLQKAYLQAQALSSTSSLLGKLKIGLNSFKKCFGLADKVSEKYKPKENYPTTQMNNWITPERSRPRITSEASIAPAPEESNKQTPSPKRR